MRYEPDLTIRGADGSLVAVIELQGVGELSPELAQGIFENYRATVGGFPPAFFLVVSPLKGYLWKKDEVRSDGSPNAELDLEPVFRGYLDPQKDSPHIRGFNYVVFRWLFGIVAGIRSLDTTAEKQLQTIGFINSVQDAHVSFGLAA